MNVAVARFEILDGEVYLDAEGTRYRVHDALYREGKRMLLPLESRAANHRYFVSADGVVRVYAFARNQIRVMTLAHLIRQLRSSSL